MTRILTVTASYPRDADTVFAEALSFDEMRAATRGVARYEGLPAGTFEEGATYVADVTLWGILRNPGYRMHVARLDRAARVVESREAGRSIRRWTHVLSVVPDGAGCIWTDRVEIDAGVGTWLAVRLARRLYGARHRNRDAETITARIARA
jgi:hypothetical protein